MYARTPSVSVSPRSSVLSKFVQPNLSISDAEHDSRGVSIVAISILTIQNAVLDVCRAGLRGVGVDTLRDDLVIEGFVEEDLANMVHLSSMANNRAVGSDRVVSLDDGMNVNGPAGVC